MISVLYVDDERDLLEIARIFLEKTGEFRVGTSTSAQEALDSLSVLSYDAIISDYQMPEMDGIAFLKAVRQRYGDIPFILFTGRGREEVVIEAINNGADFYIQKGGDPKAQFAELSHKIRQAVARRQAERLLIESEKRLSDIINFLPDATFAIDRSGHVIAWNRAIEEMTGVAAPDMVGKGDHEYAIPFYGERRPILIDLIFEPNEFIARDYAHIIHEKDLLIAETSLPRPKGKPAILMGKASPLYNREGDIVGAIESIRDITGLKKAEEGISRVKKDWETIFRAIGHPAIVLDANNQIIDANDAAIRTTGMALDLLIGKHCYEVFHGPGAVCPPEGCPFEKMRRTGSTETSEMESEALNRFYEVSCTPVYDAAGRLEKVIHIAMDVTERRRDRDELKAAYEQISASEEELRGQYEELAKSEQRIRESEEKYRNLAENTADILFSLDREGNITYVSPQVARLGFNPEELAGNGFLPIIHPEDRERIFTTFKSEMTTGDNVASTFRLIDKSGLTHWVEERSNILFDDQKRPRGLQGVIRDITERKRAEDALRESEAKFRAIIDQSFQFIGLMIPDGTLIDANRSALAFAGISESTVINRPFWETPWWSHSADLQEILKDAIKRAASGETVRFEATHPAADGHLANIDFSIRPVLDPAGRVLYLIPEGRDITERKLAEEALRESEEKYRTLVEHSEDGVVIVQDERLVFVNRALSAMIGYPEEELLGHSVEEFIAPEDLGTVMVLHRERMSGKQVPSSYEYSLLHRDGRTRVATKMIAGTAMFRGRPALIATFHNVTEERKRGEVLRESEERYRNFIANASEGIFRIDFIQPVIIDQPYDQIVQDIAEHAIIGEVNVALASMYGLRPEAMTGRPVRDFAPNCGTQMADLLNTPEYRIIEREEEEVSANGEPVYIVESFFGVVQDGILQRVWGVQRNITDRKRAEDARRESEERFRALVETTSDFIWEVGADGAYTYISPKIRDVLGYDPEEMIGKTPFDLMPPDEAARVAAEFNRFVEARQPFAAMENKNVHKNGIVVILETSGVPWFAKDGTFAGYRGIDRDITERKRVEDALRENEKRLRLITENMADQVSQIDKNRTILYISPSVERLMGYRPEELIGQTVTDYIHPDDTERVVRETRAAIDRHLLSVRLEYRYRHKNGEYHWFESESRILYDERGEYSGAVFASRDITDRKVTELALKNAEENYRTLVENSQSIIYTIRPDGIMTFVSPSWATLLGHEPSEVVDHDFRIFVHKDDIPRCEELLKITVETGTMQPGVEYRVFHKDGSMRWHRSNVIPVFDNNNLVSFVGNAVDFTDRKRAEEALRESEEKFRTIVDTTSEWIWEIDLEGRHTYSNAVVATILGYYPEEIGSANAFNLMHPEDRERARELFTSCIRERKGWRNVVFRWRHKDNSYRYLESNSIPIFDPSGKMTGFRGADRDITDRIHAEETLRESEAQYKQIFESFVDIYYETDTNGIVRVISPSVYALTGWRPEELIGNSVMIVYLNPSDRQVLIERLERDPAVSGFEVMLKKRDGTPVPVSVNARIRYAASGEPYGILGSIRDITENVRARKAIQESETKYRRILENMQDAYFRVDRDGYLTMVSPSAARIYGYGSPDEMIGMPAASLYYGSEKRQEMLQKLQEGGGRIADITGEALRKDGTTFWVSLNVQFIVDDDGRIDGTEGIVRDITERKMMDHAIQEANRKLNLLNSITRHDVANQLTVLQGFTQIAAMKESDPVIADFLSKIDATAQTIARQIEFTRTYQELGVQTPAWFRLDETIAKAGIKEVTFSNTCRHTEIFADPMLERVFFNIFENAIRHGKRVTEIAVRCERAPDGLVIIAEDDGVGIPPEEKEKIFDKGYGKNTGFGLFLAKEILAITGITIRETGYMGIGARFEITVPKGAYQFVPVNNPAEQG